MIRHMGAALIAASSFGMLSAQTVETGVLDFEGLPAGTIVSELNSVEGVGPVLIYGENPGNPGVNHAVIFDSASPTGGDTDLGTPNEDFGGPGIGDGGSAGAPFENAIPYGKILIGATNLTDIDNDGLVDVPNDEGFFGSQLTFDFRTVAAPFTPDSIVVEAIGILDIEESQLGELAQIHFYDDADLLIETLPVPDLGNNGATILDASGIAGVAYFIVDFAASGSVTEVAFRIEEQGGGTEGCPALRWKRDQAKFGPTGFTPGSTVDELFANASLYGLEDSTLSHRLRFQWSWGLQGAAKALIRQGIAAALNASHPDVSYPRSLESILTDVDAALLSCDAHVMLCLAWQLKKDNTLGCPLPKPEKKRRRWRRRCW